jgi:hypothetical protein
MMSGRFTKIKSGLGFPANLKASAPVLAWLTPKPLRERL